jgi:CBS domain-containing protein
MAGTTVFDVMQIMVNSNVQRVPVVSPENTIENYVTQSALVQHFSKNSAKLGRFAECSLAELGFQPKTVFSVKEHAPAIDAFKLMSEHKITGVPILDSEGEIITNISSKELRNVLTDPQFLDKLQLPAERFASELKSKTFLHNAETMYPKICCKFSHKFIDVLSKLAATKIHRIYVVEDGSRPIGVISLDDIVAKVFELATKKEVHSVKSLSAQ